MEIAVLDGQGGGLGKSIIIKLISELGSQINITALGTNSFAAKSMFKAGASVSIYGEDSILSYLGKNEINFLIGPIGILCAGGINGEITPKIAEAVFSNECTKYILPLKKHGFFVPGASNMDIKEMLNEIVQEIKKCQE